jgi:hypothetical protein
VTRPGLTAGVFTHLLAVHQIPHFVRCSLRSQQGGSRDLGTVTTDAHRAKEKNTSLRSRTRLAQLAKGPAFAPAYSSCSSSWDLLSSSSSFFSSSSINVTASLHCLCLLASARYSGKRKTRQGHSIYMYTHEGPRHILKGLGFRVCKASSRRKAHRNTRPRRFRSCR